MAAGRSGGRPVQMEGEGMLSEPLLDCAAAAALLNVRVSWVREATRLGQLPCLRVGRHLRFTRPMLEGWLAEQVAGVPATGRSRGVYARPSGRAVGGAAAGVFRRGSEPALLASLAEKPKGK